METNW